MIALLRSQTERALAEGYAALRVTGEMSWASRDLPGSERLIDYEAKLFCPGDAEMVKESHLFTDAWLLAGRSGGHQPAGSAVRRGEDGLDRAVAPGPAEGAVYL